MVSFLGIRMAVINPKTKARIRVLVQIGRGKDKAFKYTIMKHRREAEGKGQVVRSQTEAITPLA